MAKKMTEDQRYSLAMLREWLPPGTVISTLVQGTSSSGTSKAIVPMIVRNGSILPIGWLIGRAGIARYNVNKGTVSMRGGNIDLQFELVHTLGRYLYPEGFACLGDSLPGYRSCPSNEHSMGPRDYSPTRMHMNDSGYCFFHDKL